MYHLLIYVAGIDLSLSLSNIIEGYILRLILISFLQHIERPTTLLEEEPRAERLNPVARVDKMFEQIQAKLQKPPQFILCVIPKKGSDIYGMAFVSII